VLHVQRQTCLELEAVYAMSDMAAHIVVLWPRDKHGHVDSTELVLLMAYAIALLGFPDLHVNSTQTAMQTTWDMNAPHRVYVLATIWATMVWEAIWEQIWATMTTPMPSTLLPMTQASTQHVKTWCSSSKSTGRRLSDCRFEAWPMKVPTTP
jgi:hypothetical protein